MLRSIFYKEYLKIRWAWLAVLALNALLMTYVFVETRHLFSMDHPEIVWYRVLHLGQIHYAPLRYVPAGSGLLLACLQYLPEMVGERLRLSLHLPFSPHGLIMAHVLVGLTAVGLVIGLDLLALALLTARYFPLEAVNATMLTALPWGVAGLAAYLGVTLGLLEPNARRRIFNLAVAAGIVGLFLYSVRPGAYSHLLPFLGVLVLLMMPAVLLPAYHFRFRRTT